MNISRRLLNHYLHGDTYPHVYGLYRLCEARGVDSKFNFTGNRSHLPYGIAVRLAEQEPHRGEAVSAAPWRSALPRPSRIIRHHFAPRLAGSLGLWTVPSA
jgi:hypothetical protein